MNFALRSFIFSITLRVVQLSGQVELACPPSFGRERLVRTHAVERLVNKYKKEHNMKNITKPYGINQVQNDHRFRAKWDETCRKNIPIFSMTTKSMLLQQRRLTRI
jgi:hypothetical protein